MTTKKSTASKTPQRTMELNEPQFVGSYVREMVEVLTASALSGEWASVLGPPGFGKSDIADAVAREMLPTPEEQYLLIEVEPSTPPSRIVGMDDPASILDPNLRNADGSIKRIIAGTPYDSRTQIVCLDEMYRGNDAFHDACIPMLRLSKQTGKIVWATSNFVVPGERLNAVIDRFPLWYHIHPEFLDARQIVGAHLRDIGNGGLALPCSVPDWAVVQEVRGMKVGEQAAECISDLIETLSQEASQQGIRPNPRLQKQWAYLVFRVGAFHAGSNDFDSVPKEAARILRYAFPAIDAATSAKWMQIASSIVDAVGAAVDTVMHEAKTKYDEVMRIKDPQARVAKVGELGQFLAGAQATLKQVGGKDPRVAESISTIKNWLGNALVGDDGSDDESENESED